MLLWCFGWFKLTITSCLPCRQQTAEDFMDEDELAAAHAQSLSTHAPYDTFGSQAAAEAKKAAQAEDQGAVPGLLPQAWIEPVADSIGASLCRPCLTFPGCNNLSRQGPLAVLQRTARLHVLVRQLHVTVSCCRSAAAAARIGLRLGKRSAASFARAGQSFEQQPAGVLAHSLCTSAGVKLLQQHLGRSASHARQELTTCGLVQV